MAKVTLIIEDTDAGLSVTPHFEPLLDTLPDDHTLSTAQQLAFDLLNSLASQADEVVLENDVFRKSKKAQGKMH